MKTKDPKRPDDRAEHEDQGSIAAAAATHEELGSIADVADAIEDEGTIG